MSAPTAPPELPAALRALRPGLRRAFAFALVAGLLALSATAYMFEVYDRVLNSRNPTTLAMLTLAALFVYAVMEALHWAQSETLREAGAALDERLSRRVHQAMLARSRTEPPSLQPMNDLRALRDILCSGAMAAAMEAPLALAFLALLALISPVLAWLALACAVALAGLGWLQERATQPWLLQANRFSAEAQVRAAGLFRNAEAVTAMGMVGGVQRRWSALQRQGLDAQALASRRAGGFQALSRWLQNTLSSLLLGLGAWLLLRDELHGGPGWLIVASVLGGRMLAPLVQLMSQWALVVEARAAFGRLSRLLEQHPARGAAMALPAPRGPLAVEALFVAPPGRPPWLKGLQFALQPGEVLVVAGPSASGKTLLARALVGLLPAASGKVRLDGVDLHGWDAAELGPHLGYLPQRVGLLDGTVAQNIARFGEVDPAKVQEAAAAVGLHELITGQLPQGYDTPVGRGGGALSGGMRQRVALARALYGGPAFVVLDEPNASLDAAGDEALARAVLALKARGTTFVVMSHRTGVLALADKLMLLVDGAQKAFGRRDNVLALMRQAAAPAQPAFIHHPPRQAGA